MNWRLIPAATLAFGLLTGCYVDQVDDRNMDDDNRQKSTGGAAETDPQVCKTTLSKGCFDGHVVAKKDLFVEGKEFFNADDLTQRFSELLVVKGGNLALTAGTDYDLVAITPLDNASFTQGFEYYITGDYNRSGSIRPSGNFSINELPEGTYDLRVQKSIKFQLVKKAKAPNPGNGGNEPAQPQQPQQPAQPQQPEQPQQPAEQNDQQQNDAQQSQEQQEVQAPVQESKTICATIYLDTQVDVRRGKRLTDTFKDFRLHVLDGECQAAGQRVITL